MDRPSWRLDHLRLQIGDITAAARVLRAAGFAVAELGGTTRATVLVHEHIELESGTDAWPRLTGLALEPHSEPEMMAAGGGGTAALRRVDDGGIIFAETTLAAADRAPFLPLLRSRQLAPERLRTPQHLAHPNGARALVGATIVVANPAQAAAELANLVGRAKLTATDSVVAVHLGRATLLLTTAADAQLLHPDLVVDLDDAPPAAPLVVALTIEVAGLEAAAAALESGAARYRRRIDGSLAVRLTQLGVALELRGPA